jgi:hypothetical protein
VERRTHHDITEVRPRLRLDKPQAMTVLAFLTNNFGQDAGSGAKASKLCAVV